jgi:predicted RNA-binding Zn ribbon-like protein
MIVMDKPAGDRFYFIANNLALDFVNTLIADENGNPLELIATPNELLDWAVAAAILKRDQILKIQKRPGRELNRDLDRALSFRRVLKNMASALAGGKRVPSSAVNAINEVLSQSKGHFELSATPSGYAVDFQIEEQEFPDILMPIAESAAKLLSRGDLNLVRKCQRSACVLYFYDTSKRHGRRWCTMTVCGNRSKAAAFYRRTRDK